MKNLLNLKISKNYRIEDALVFVFMLALVIAFMRSCACADYVSMLEQGAY